MTLTDALLVRYPHDDDIRKSLRENIIELCQRHIDSGLADADVREKLCSANDAVYWQQFTEVLLADQLVKAGVTPFHSGKGPDFHIQHEGRRIWIEVITPEPVGLPPEWLDPNHSGCLGLPHVEILLRWTSAIKEKAEKLLGNDLNQTHGYLQKGIVGPNDSYVIAINGYLLRHPRWGAQLIGISQFPFAVESTFCVGPLQVRIDLTTMKASGAKHQHRPVIPKANGAKVPANTFLDDRFKPISAIWAVDLNENFLCGYSCPMAVVHNPLAINPIPEKFLPAQNEYVASDQGDEYQLERRDGILM